MKPIALTLSALLLASFHPFGVLAVEPYADMNTDQNVIDDYTSQLTTNIEDPTSAFLSLTNLRVKRFLIATLPVSIR